MTRIFEQLAAEFTSHIHHKRYDSTDPTEVSMSLLDSIRNEFSSAVAWGEDEFRRALPTVAKAADDAEALASSATAQAVIGAVLSPEDESLVLAFVQRLDQKVHNLQAGEQPVAEQPAEPVPVAQ